MCGENLFSQNSSFFFVSKKNTRKNRSKEEHIMALSRSLLSPFALSQVTGTGPREGGRLLLFRRHRPSSPSTAAAVVSRVVLNNNNNNNRRFVRAAAAEEEEGQMEKRDEERQQRARLSAPMLLKRVLSGDPYGERPRARASLLLLLLLSSSSLSSSSRFLDTK